MTKDKFIDAVARSTYVDKKTCSVVVDAVFEQLTTAMESGDYVTLSRFGTFKPVQRKAKTCHNFHTGEAVILAARRAPVFVASDELKQRVGRLPQ